MRGAGPGRGGCGAGRGGPGPGSGEGRRRAGGGGPPGPVYRVKTGTIFDIALTITKTLVAVVQPGVGVVPT